MRSIRSRGSGRFFIRTRRTAPRAARECRWPPGGDQAFRSPPRRTRLGGSRPRHSPSTAMSAIARRASRMLPTRTRGRWRGAADGGDVAGASGRMPRASWRCATRAAGRVRAGEGPCSAAGPDAWGVGPSRRLLSERARTLSKGTNSKTARTRMGSMVTVGPLLWPSPLARPSAARDPCGRLPSERGLDPLWRDRQDRALRIPDDTLRSAAKQDVAQVRSAPGPEDHEVAVGLLDELGDAPAMTRKVEDRVPRLELGHLVVKGPAERFQAAPEPVSILLLVVRRDLGRRSPVVQPVPRCVEHVQPVPR